MEKIFLWLESFLSGVFPLVFLSVTGVYFTLKTKGWQFRNLGRSIKFSLCSKSCSKEGISSFSAVCNSLAATVGTGNIAGVAAAITTGGAGAVFWMWIFSFLSMVIKAVEITLAIKYRNGHTAGPLCYLEKVFKGKLFVRIFAVIGVFASFCIGNITQVNSSAEALGDMLVLRLLLGVLFGAATAVIISGGAKKIANFTTFTVPLMAVLYIVFCLGVIGANFERLGFAFCQIIKGAILPKAVSGGAVGSVLSCVLTGAKKGIFSNEAGIGTSGMAHSSAVDADIKTQGLFGVFEVFVDTVVICGLTALTILSSGVIIDYNTVASSGLVVDSLKTIYGSGATVLLSVMLCVFALSSIIGWGYYGMEFSSFLSASRGRKIYCFVYPVFCVFGAVARVDVAFRLAEFFGGLMLIINLFAVFLRSRDAVSILKGEDYGKKNKKDTKLFKRW